jgi:hypothetical protein
LVVGLALIMAGAVEVARLGLVHAGVPAAAVLALVVPFGVLVYGGLLLVAAPAVISELRVLVQRRRGR